MIVWLAEIMGRRRTARRFRLEQAEVLAIARRAAVGDSLCEQLSLVTVAERSGRQVWIVSSATVGQMLEVWVDDGTGEVLDIRRVGVR